MQQRLVAIGDSITLGHWDPGGGWVTRIRRASDEVVIASERERYSAVYNLGISSNTSADVRRRYVAEVSARLLGSSDEEAFVALAVGINDSQLKDGEELVSLGEYRDNMDAIVAAGLQREHRIVVVGLTGVYEQLTNPVRWDSRKGFRNDRIAEFNGIARTVAEEHGLEFADLFGISDLRDARTHLDWDGLHLNPDGHERVSEVIAEALRRAGWGFDP